MLKNWYKRINLGILCYNRALLYHLGGRYGFRYGEKARDYCKVCTR